MPTRIDPCPILEAIAEVRFVTAVAEEVILGMLYAEVRERFPDSVKLPVASIPLEARASNPALIHQPAVQFHSREFLIQVGSRVVGIAIKPKQYLGWNRMRTEIEYLLEALKKAAFISEAERLAVRYINFFEEDVYPKIEVEVLLEGKPYRAHEMAIISTFKKGAATARLSVANNAVAKIESRAVPGSILDIDVWFSSLDFDLFEQGLEKFEEAHLLLKQIFFGLLRPEFLASLNPKY
ncbi:MAG: TIGR04255 family protein [Verrucomicrobia bacterium]|nr:TIGR04255 family protein [Verrucomicrobiota bacterium]MBV9643927.1 TIGR04255 family protein [Verrucomicrobiota bacterium]